MSAVNLTSFRVEMISVLGLDIVNDLALMDYYINQGVTDVLVRTHCKVLPFTITTTADRGDYTIDTSMLVIVDLYVSSQSSSYALTRVTPAELLDMRRNIGNSSPSHYYATAGANLFMLYPIPTGEDEISGLYVPRPAFLVNGTDYPSEIPAEHHNLVSLYALSRAADADDDASSDMGERYRQLYEQGVARARSQIYKHGGTRMAPARVRANRRTFPANPSVPSYP